MKSSLHNQLKYFKQLVNTRTQRIIQYLIVKKINRKKEIDVRLCVATTAALYLAKETMIGRSIKISRMYAWVDLEHLKVFPPDKFCFSFGRKGEINLIAENMDEFLINVVAFLHTLLPSDLFKADYDLPLTYPVKTAPVEEMQFLDLFISESISKGIDVDKEFLLQIENSIHHHFPITIDRSQISEGYANSLLKALYYSTGITKIRVGGGSSPHFYISLAQILDKNKNIKSITFFAIPKNDGFKEFCSVLSKSSLNELIFEKISFNSSTIELFLSQLTESNINSIGFSDCSFSKVIFQSFEKNPEFLSRINSLQINDDKSVFSIHQLSSFMQFINITECMNLEICSTDLDITNFFFLLSNPDSKITTIHLCKNVASKNFTGNYNLPASIRVIDLSEVQWKGNSFENLLKFQNFNPNTQLNLSNTKISSWGHIWDSLPQSPPFSSLQSLDFSKNPITSRFIAYIGNLSFLSELSLSNCTFSRSDGPEIIVQLSKLIEKSISLVTLNLSKTMKPLHEQFLDSLCPIFTHHPTLEKLDISDNCIGLKGLTQILKLLQDNTKITSINLDGSEPENIMGYVQFLRSISQMGSFPPRTITKPRHDITFLAKKKDVKEVKKAWSALDHNKKKSSHNQPELETDTDHSEYASLSSVADRQLVKYLAVSWDFQNETTYPENTEEWERLKEQFSLEKLTGIKMSSKQDPKDLIEFS